MDLQVLNNLQMVGTNAIVFSSTDPSCCFSLYFYLFWSPHQHLMPLHLFLDVLPSC